MTNQSTDDSPLLWNYYAKRGIFRREEYYFGLLCLVCALIVLYCKSDFYSFGLESILSIGGVLANVYLGLSTIMEGAYDIRTKEFYSLFYLFIPVYFIIGLFPAFFISPYRYRLMIIGMSKIKISFALVLGIFLALLPMVAPMVGFNNPTWLTIVNTILTSGIFYAVALLLMSIVIKFNLRGK